MSKKPWIDPEATKAITEPGVNNVNEIIENQLKFIAKAKEMEALLGGGALVEVARVYGKPLYMRVDPRDPELAKHEIAEMQSIVKSMVIPSD
jgi:hypothetical protein